MPPKLLIGDLVWKLSADLSGLEDAMDSADKKLEKSKKKQGGILGLLTSKWAIVGAAATGAAYAMIRASPSLSFAMEEVAYRFEYMLAILGEEFAPLIEDILLPALDAFIPLIKEIAPMIGTMVGFVVENLTKLAPVFDRVLGLISETFGRFFATLMDPEYQELFSRLIDAVIGIADAILDIVEPALGILLGAFEIIAPILETVLVVALEMVADYLGIVALAIGTLIGWIADNDKLMGWLGKVSDFLTGDVVNAIEEVGKWFGTFVEDIEAIVESFSKEGGLFSWLEKIAGFFVGGFITAIETLRDSLLWFNDNVLTPIISAFETLWDFFGAEPELSPAWEQQAEQIQAIAEITGSGGAATELGPGIPGAQAGGYVERSGLAIIHRGETIIPQVGGTPTSNIEVHIHMESIQITSDHDITEFVERISQELKANLGQSIF